MIGGVLAANIVDAESDTPDPRPLILVVDDHPNNTRVLYEILKNDYEVCASVSGQDALAFCFERPPDLVLLNISMPGMDGHEVARRLKGAALTREIPIIFVTAHDTPSAEARALGEGAMDFITKPVHAQVFKARVRNQITQKLQGDKLRSLAMTDGLMGIANRRRFDEVLAEACRRAARDQTCVSLLMADVDRFKSYNDQYGHPAGDRCLQLIAQAANGVARRPGDLVARYGGEELAIILPGADAAFAAQAAEDMVASIRRMDIPHGGNGDCGGIVTLCVGGITVEAGGSPPVPEAMIAAADEALYDAKQAGRDRAITRNLPRNPPDGSTPAKRSPPPVESEP